MNKLLLKGVAAAFCMATMFGTTACGDDDDLVNVEPPVEETQDVILEGEITSDMTLKAADNNLLRGFVYVTDGVTLTIEPGTVIKGEKSSKGSLIVERGGKLIAEGTAEKPIVFTSDQPKVSFCGDDSFEWFGGTVNAKHLIAYKGWDDEFDTDYGFQGKLQFLLGVRDPKHADTSKSNGFESDNDADGSNNTPLTTPVFSNVTLIGPFYGESAGKTENDIFYVTEDAANGAKGGSFQAAMGAVVKNVIFAGMWENFKDETSQNYFQTADLSNLTYASSNDIIAKDGDYTSIVADKIDGADFSDTALNDAFFEKVSYKGAFDGKNDWAANWTNFDPNNTEY